MARKEETKKQNMEKLDLSIYPKDEKGNAILPADVFDKFGKLLPDGTKSDDGRVAFNGGVLRTLGNNPERDREIRRKGAETLNAMHAERRSMAETINVLLKQKASADVLQKLGLPEGTDNQTAALVSILMQMQEGDTKAAVFLRDTVGEKPVDKKEIDAQIMTENDRKLLEKVSKRLEQEEE